MRNFKIGTINKFHQTFEPHFPTVTAHYYNFILHKFNITRKFKSKVSYLGSSLWLASRFQRPTPRRVLRRSRVRLSVPNAVDKTRSSRVRVFRAFARFRGRRVFLKVVSSTWRWSPRWAELRREVEPHPEPSSRSESFSDAVKLQNGSNCIHNEVENRLSLLEVLSEVK